MSVFNDDIIEIHKPITLRADDGLSVPNDDEVDFDYCKDENDSELDFDYYNEGNDNIEDIVDSAIPDKKTTKKEEKEDSNVLAILSLIFSIFGLLTSCIAIGLLFGIAALVLAILAYRKGQNKKTCIASFVCSGLAILFGMIILIAALSSPVQNTEIDSNSSITVEK